MKWMIKQFVNIKRKIIEISSMIAVTIIKLVMLMMVITKTFNGD